MSKNIVFFIQNFSRSGGSERVTSVIANGLSQLGYSVSVVSICGDNTCFFPINKEVRLFTLVNKPDVDNRRSFPLILTRLSHFFRNNDVDVCVDVFASLSIYTILLKKIYNIKNVTWEHFNYKVNLGMNRLGRQFAVRWSDQIVTLTKRDMEYYASNNSIRGRIDYIYNPSPYQNVLSDVTKRKKQVISVGRLTSQKGFDRLIRIWSRIEHLTDWDLLIFGEGEDRELLQALIEEEALKRIKLMGAVKNVDDYYREASLYVSTARFEGLPMTMIEAQSFGLPIVTYDYDTGPSEIVTDGVDGVIIPRSTECEMEECCAEQLLHLMETDALTSLGFAAKESSKRFDCSLIIMKWDRLLQKL